VTGLRSLVASLVDYAGLFPPASLTMEKAVENYQRYRLSPAAWMLGRFVVPASRLEEFEAAAVGHAAIPVTVTLGANFEDDVERIKRARTRIDVMEIKAGSAEEIDQRLAQLSREITVYFEVADLKLIPVARKKGARAKIRTGGVTAAAFPSAEFIAEFLETCARTGTAFKATAGLHHALYGIHPLDGSPGGPSGWMFGFLNVFVAAMFARKGVPAQDLAPLLVTESATEILFGPGEIEWRGHRVSEREILAARRDFAISFGSCSFEEPVADLKELGLAMR
jgi:hypothetical protein